MNEDVPSISVNSRGDEWWKIHILTWSISVWLFFLQKLEILTINISLLCNFQRNKRINRIYQLIFPIVRIIFCRGGILSVMCCETNQIPYQMFPDGIVRKKKNAIKMHCVMHQLFTFLSSVATCKKGYYAKNIKYTKIWSEAVINYIFQTSWECICRVFGW